MAIDRAAVLRNAEKLIRQGKLEAAIADYVRIVDDQPRDWNSANVLGDLYARAGQTDKAIEQFMQIAESLGDEGALSKAGAIYKKILKLKPDHEHVLIQLSDLLGGQGLFADARVHLNAVVDLRRQRGDARGAAQGRIRLGLLDPTDFAARRAAVAARLEIGDVRGALNDLKEIAAGLSESGRTEDAIDVLREAGRLDGDDPDIAEQLVGLHLAAGNLDGARDCAKTSAHLVQIAGALDEQGRDDDAFAVLREAGSLDPDNVELRSRLAHRCLARGDSAAAGEYLTTELAGDDLTLVRILAEVRIRGGAVAEGLTLAQRLLDEEADGGKSVAALGWELAADLPDVGFEVVQLAANRSIDAADWSGAASALQEFARRAPRHVPALLRLVEICVDGELAGALGGAQARLADAYIEAGAASEARFIAEDLVTRHPWDREHVERARRALALAGEGDPDLVIADLLSAESPFPGADFLSDEPADSPEPEVAGEPEPSAEPAPRAAVPDVRGRPSARVDEPEPMLMREDPRVDRDRGHFELSANAIDFESILRELEGPPAPKTSRPVETVEVDLTTVLSDISKGAPVAAAAARVDIDRVFAEMRDRAVRSTKAEEAAGQYQRALELREAGDVDGAIAALKVAAREPSGRFASSALLGRSLVERGKFTEAIEWFERAVQAPAPSVREGHDLLYDLADALEQVGEVARALAISLELQIEAGAYRDIGVRIERLKNVQAGE